MPNPSEGCLRLNCLENARGWRNLWDTPNLLLEKVAGPSMELTARLVFRPAYEGDRAGLAVMGLDYSTLELFYDGEKVSLQRRLCTDADAGGTERITDSIPLETVFSEAGKPFCTVWVRVNVHGKDSAWTPAVGCGFSYSLDGRRFRPLGEDFTAREGKWIGAKAGFFATATIKKNDGGSVEIF
jgi:hypothetical protein